MKHITDSTVETLIDGADAQGILTDAFLQFGRGQAAMQERMRTEALDVKLSTLGAVIPGQDVAGAKVYTTVDGRFSFVILLFSTTDGRPLASFDAAAITRLRTAACSVIAARHLAIAEPRRMALFGCGTQGREHALQMARAYPLEEIRVCDPRADESLAHDLERDCQVRVRLVAPEEAIADCEIVVTASRARKPVFAGARLARGSFVAAIGSSLPTTRELDDTTLARASVVAVDWRAQAMRESGDLALVDQEALPPGKVVELGELLTGQARGRHHDTEITVYKAVGVGLQDIALAGEVWRRLAT